MRSVFELLGSVADMDTTVLIHGETGVGKELLARSLHFSGARRDRPFVAVNCAAIPEELFESELFGFRRGAFTGAHDHRRGQFQMAHGGTLLLDEIGEMPLHLQSKLLRVIEEKKVDLARAPTARSTSTCASSPPPTRTSRPRPSAARSGATSSTGCP